MPKRVTILTIALATATATPALGQDSGVYYDKDDSAGKEYAIPTDDARQQAGGGSAGGSGGSTTGGTGSDSTTGGGADGSATDDGGAAAFGEGVSKQDGSERNGSEAGTVKPGDSDAAGISRSSSSAGDSASSAGDGGSSAALWSAGLALALLAAAGVAWLVRRRGTLIDST